jgi:branched-chain amino acid transport system ATP-binding protein
VPAVAVAPLLEVRGVGVQFGGVHALRGISLCVSAGAVHGLIGPNGAGKTTLVNCIGRVIRPVAGAIDFCGVDLLAHEAHDLRDLGIARTFQNLALMDDATVLDNVRVGIATRGGLSRVHDYLPTPMRRRLDRQDRDAALAALESLSLADHAQSLAGELPYGVRKTVEIARALCAQPRLLMLDEPTAGLNPSEMDALASVVHGLRVRGDLTVLLITHHIEFLLDVADHLTVLDLGTVIADGAPDLVHSNARVRAAYLGLET